jgi:hypothetical protein
VLRSEFAMTVSPSRQSSALAAGVICVECLHCRHRGVLSERLLARHGLLANVPIASFVKRLTCEQCGHQSVKAFRTTRDTAQKFIADRQRSTRHHR